ncbi:hypothetical protein Q669_00500 [Labrenzia sp. C1B10]|nr:hypothetical protein Q669_00500 [Labrenzia sp. C1B10]ERS00960.1 hypothetical protein Q675_09140 [Labrenzia sp. C1B70]
MVTLMKQRLLLVLCIMLTSCDQQPQWQGWVYPNRNDLTVSTNLGRFSTFEECRSAAISSLKLMSSPTRGDYECGYKCEWKADWDINVCVETRK